MCGRPVLFHRHLVFGFVHVVKVLEDGHSKHPEVIILALYIIINMHVCLNFK